MLMTFGKTITREFLRQHNACWSDDRIAESVPPEGLTIIEVLRRTDAPAEERIWVATREGAVPTIALQRWAIATARRALGRVDSPDPRSVAALDTAEAYLDGRCDRSALDAVAAYAAARPVARGARAYAARSTSYAAYAAARSTSYAALDAALDAARGAAWGAAWAVDAARGARGARSADAAARASERDAQVLDLIAIIESEKT